MRLQNVNGMYVCSCVSSLPRMPALPPEWTSHIIVPHIIAMTQHTSSRERMLATFMVQVLIAIDAVQSDVRTLVYVAQVCELAAVQRREI